MTRAATMTLGTAHGPVTVQWQDDYRYTTPTPCVVHRAHTPASHVNEIHHIWPRGQGGPDVADNRIVVCATGHNSIHQLIKQFEIHNGEVPYQVLRTYSFDERRLAKLGYDRITRKAM